MIGEPTENESDAENHPEAVSSKRAKLRLLAILIVILGVYSAWNLQSISHFWRTAADTGVLFPAGARPPKAPLDEFELGQSVIPLNEIYEGGPAKDGIPALSAPVFQHAEQASFMRPADRVIGVRIGTTARAYPLKILNHHEIVNDQIDETPFAVTYCPLCDSSVVFDRRTPLGIRDFGVSGLLYNSNVLMYDRDGETESLWSQMMKMGVSGPGAEKPLTTLPLEVTTWRDWQARHPQTTVLSDQTGHLRDYNFSPYLPYFESPQLMFPVNRTDQRLAPKTPVLAIWTKDAFKAYPLNAFADQRTELDDNIGSVQVSLAYNPNEQSLRITKAGESVEWMYTFWFAWFAAHPQTELYSVDEHSATE